MNNGSYMKKVLFYIFVIMSLLCIDLSSKYYVNTTICENESIPVLGNFLKFTLVFNYGTTFGISSANAPYIKISIIKFVSIIVLLVLFLNIARVFKHAKHQNISKFCIICMIGGSLGNIIDRLADKRVTDFIDIGINGFRWYVFNAADVFQVIGGLTIMFLLIGEYRYKQR
ncbi:signal peptidase II [Candidatus Latescibacterota bacterium]